MNRRGLSLVEVLVVVAILGIVSLGMMSMMDSAMKAQKGIAVKDYNREFVARIRSHLANRDACTASFGGTALTPTTTDPNWSTNFTTLRNSTNTADAFPAGSRDNPSPDIRLSELTIVQYNMRKFVTAQNTVELNIVTRKISEGTGAKELRIPITLRVNVTPGNILTSCISVGTSSDGFWQISPINTADIYYGGNFVGIGTSTPEEKLHVMGNVQADMFLFTSDARLKEDLHKAPGIEKIRHLNAYSFRWSKDGRYDVGVLAQEIEKELPHLVRTDSRGFKSVNYPGLIPVLIEANKELDQSHRQLQKKYIDLQKRIEALENK